MRIAFLSVLLSRKAGGLFVSVRQLAQVLAAHPGTQIRVFGSIDAHLEVDRRAWGSVDLCPLPIRGPRSFGFMPDLMDRLREFSPEIVHVHGLWTYVSRAAAQYCSQNNVPCVISPRGCLDSWALKNSRLKKWLALQAYEKAHLSGATVMHALAENERQAFVQFGLSAPVAVIPNGIRLHSGNRPPPPGWLKPIVAKKRVMLFLGRIHPKKGLVEFIRALALLQAQDLPALAEWHFVIGGWDEINHLEQVKAEIQKGGLERVVDIVGPLFGEEKEAVLANVHAFILPSFSEGLPMAVLEAWSWKLPTLITPECNLEIAFSRGAALKIQNDPPQLARSLKQFLEMTNNERALLAQAGYDLVNEKFTWDQIGSDMSAVYRWALNPASKDAPGCLSFT